MGSSHKQQDRAEWLCAGRTCVRTWPAARLVTQKAFEIAAAVLPGRVQRSRWVRYGVSLAGTPAPPPDVHLTALTDEIVCGLRNHADRDANQLKSGLNFWDQGLRRAYIWMADDNPLCMQWLLTSDDSERLRTLRGWTGMYPPLEAGCGQVENLFAFSGVRRKGVATNFEHALFQLARESGLRYLVTHIHEDNAPARGWADRTGWRAFGHISHYELDIPFARGRGVFVHDATGFERPALMHAAPDALRSSAHHRTSGAT